METIKAEQNAKEGRGEVSLKELLLNLKDWNRYLISKWRIIIPAAILGGAIFWYYAFSKKTVYNAVCTFVIDEQGSPAGFGQYAGIASMVGIDLGGSSGLFQGDNIIELYKSRLMIEKTLLSTVDIQGEEKLLINRFIESNQLRQEWLNDSRLAKISFDIPESKFTLQHDSILGEMVKEINKDYLNVAKPDKKLNIIGVTVKYHDELFAKEFTNKIVQNVNQFYIQTRTKKSLENLAILQRQADSVKRVLNESLSGVASALDANPNANFALQTLRVPSQRRQVDIQASSAIYSEVVKNLEMSKIALRKETPLIQIIDQAVLPLQKDKPSKVLFMLIGSLSFSMITVLFLIIKRAADI